MRIPDSTTAIPELPAAFAPRGRLVELLDRADPEQLVAVIAPAGYGKTVLLTHWLRRPGVPRAAWISLDAAVDADRFRATLCAALATVPGLREFAGLHTAARAPGGSGGSDFVHALAVALDDVRPAVRLVVDDVHALTDLDALRDLGRLVRMRPRGLRLVLAGRSDPPLPLPRLRLESRLLEVRAEQLAFTRDEAAALVGSARLDLTAEQVRALHHRTAGWAAGLRFAAIALRSTDDRQGFIDQFSGSERSMADFLAGEVMGSLAAATRQFLEIEAVCAELPAGLAVALSGQADAAHRLDALVKDTALLQRVEPATYRIHPLLRTYLVAELERHHPVLHRHAHATSARWWCRADEPVHAVRHAARTGDPGLLNDILGDVGLRAVARGAFSDLRRMLDVVRGAGGPPDAWVPLLEAVVEHRTGTARAAAAALEQAERSWPRAPGPALTSLRGAVELLVRGHRTTPLPAGAPGGGAAAEALRLLLDLSRASAQLEREDLDRDAALARLDRVVAVARERDFACLEVWGLSLQSLVELGRGRYSAMAAAAGAAVVVATRSGLPAVLAAAPNALIAYRDLLAADPVAARQRAAATLSAGGPLPVKAELILRAVHSAALSDLGRPDGGLARWREALVAHGDRAPAATLAALAVLEHRVAVVQAGASSAARTTEWLEARVGKVAEVLLMDAWAHQLAGQHHAAAIAVEPIVRGAVPRLVAYTPVEAHLVLAESALQAGAPDRGREELETALAQASELEVARPFALTSGATEELLTVVTPVAAGAWLRHRIDSARPLVHNHVPAALSERELAVLAMLPSLLSAAEIAEELTVSVNTVKTHIRSIYAKLHVSSRRDAVERARERSLLA
ncbi:LuxR C-terminal-related transcriptional regulator [Pseudonocardia zijingensis]|uniref:LuxR C-terminal-related transcriptional regulator n=1 Tax=Pseudonocardia zijingensis TaxID=153376 RepID=A0ABN1PXF8_9PSEU